MKRLLTHTETSFEDLLVEDPENLRYLGHQLVDMLIDYLKSANQGLWPNIMSPNKINEMIGDQIPDKGEALDQILPFIKEKILPNCINTLQPKVMSLFSTPLSSAAFFDTITSFLNIQPYGQLSSSIEKLLISSIGAEIGFSKQASGVLTSGGTSANLYGLAMARTRIMTPDIRMKGMFNLSKMMVYVSTEGHSCIEKSIDILGIGIDQIRRISVDESFRIDLKELKSTIQDDLQEGFLPFCIIANVGSANVGAVDPLEELAELAKEYNLWLHADGAYGALAALTDKRKELLKGLKKVDSVVLDFHKWFNIPYEAGCVMAQDSNDLINTFNNIPGYLSTDGIISEVQKYTFELSKKDRGMTIWLTLRRYGLDTFKTLIDRHIGIVEDFAEKIKGSQHLELLCKPQLSICCFRFINSAGFEPMDEKYLNNLNKAIKFALNANEDTLVSGVNIEGKFYLRISLINYRTSSEEVDSMMKNVIKYGMEYDLKMSKKLVKH